MLGQVIAPVAAFGVVDIISYEVITFITCVELLLWALIYSIYFKQWKKLLECFWFDEERDLKRIQEIMILEDIESLYDEKSDSMNSSSD